MTRRILLLAVMAALMVGSQALAQDKKSPASPSDIPVDQIKKEAGVQDKAAPKPNDTKPADPKPAVTKAPEKASQSNDDKTDAPKPVAEGTVVAQPPCQSSTGCSSCDPCGRRCRGQWLGRFRSLLGRRCCR